MIAEIKTVWLRRMLVVAYLPVFLLFGALFTALACAREAGGQFGTEIRTWWPLIRGAWEGK